MGKGRGRRQEELIREHSRIQHQRMLAQDEEVSKCRNRRRFGSKETTKSKTLRRLKILYIPTVGFLCLGLVMILGSIVQGLGEGTVFWEKREQFHIVGPIVLTVGVIFLFITVGIMTHLGSKEDDKTIKSLVTEFRPVVTNKILLYPEKRSFFTGDNSSIPIMSFADEELYAQTVKPKPMDFREKDAKLTNNYYVLPARKPKVNYNNNNTDFSELDIPWPEGLLKKYTIEEDCNAHSSLPLLLERSLDKQIVMPPTRQYTESYDLSGEDIRKLPESVI